MTEFDLEKYKEGINDLLNDIFYLDGHSFRGKISDIRIYSEFIVRKLLEIPGDEYLTLGNSNIKSKLKEVSSNDKFLMETVDSLKKIGNNTSHSQDLRKYDEEEYRKTLHNLLKLQAYLFINYFKKNRFGNNLKVVEVFSILPPELRYEVLNHLYLLDNKNILVIDKLTLSILKDKGIENALNWLEEKKTHLITLECIAEQAKEDILQEYGQDYLNAIISGAPENMYKCCIKNVNDVSVLLETRGVLYKTFEEAKQLYLEEGILDGNSKEENEFNSIMEFLYTGRNIKENEKLKYLADYIVFN